MNRIVYVGIDGNIFTINPDGTDSKRLTGSVTARSMGSILAQPAEGDNVLHTWPTWAHAGDRIAVSRAVLEGQAPEVSLFVIDAEAGSLERVYTNEAGANTVIAQSVPHYLYWSPNDEKLAFIAPTTESLVLYVNDGSENSVVSSSGPLYFKWANDGESMLIHSREDLFRAAAPFDTIPDHLGPMSPIFRTPDISPDGQTAAYITESGQGYALLTGDANGSETFGELIPVEAPAAILWSPVEDVIAVADGARSGAPGYRQIRLVYPDGREPVTLVEGVIAAFYWSPDGQRIAYVSIDMDTRSLLWKVVSVNGGAPWELTKFTPTQGTLTAMSFFDQYAHSHSFWSPDSSSLVFAGQTGRGIEETNGAGPDQGSVYVISTEPGSLPRRIASGTLAFWSWN